MSAFNHGSREWGLNLVLNVKRTRHICPGLAYLSDQLRFWRTCAGQQDDKLYCADFYAGVQNQKSSRWSKGRKSVIRVSAARSNECVVGGGSWCSQIFDVEMLTFKSLLNYWKQQCGLWWWILFSRLESLWFNQFSRHEKIYWLTRTS